MPGLSQGLSPEDCNDPHWRELDGEHPGWVLGNRLRIGATWLDVVAVRVDEIAGDAGCEPLQVTPSPLGCTLLTRLASLQQATDPDDPGAPWQTLPIHGHQGDYVCIILPQQI